MTPIGFHVSISGGLQKAVERAQKRKCSSFQIFCGNPRGWAIRTRRSEEIRAFSLALNASGISTVAVHACYLINPCSESRDISARSVERLGAEMAIASRLGVDYYVLHPGSSKGALNRHTLERAAQAIVVSARRCSDTTGAVPHILLENTAGDYGPGGNFSTLGGLRDAIESMDRTVDIGFAIDTCHAHAAGYDLTDQRAITLMEKDIQAYLGADSLKLIHANDSACNAGAGRDRHAHIGEGTIGIRGFLNFFSVSGFANRPIILETPFDGEKTDTQNLARLGKIIGKKCHPRAPDRS